MGREKELTGEQGRGLVLAARQSILREFGRDLDAPGREAVAALEDDPAMAEKRATFVTLTKNGRLRGCIGNLTPCGTLLESVRRNARQAAFGDHRFAPLAADEADMIDIEVSILTEPRPLAVSSPEDLAAALRPGVDGVIIRRGRASATFLPQVWEQLPRVEDFLGHLCLKAGLTADAWRLGGVRASVYQVRRFP